MVMAIRVHQTGDPEVLRWEAIAMPVPRAHEVLVRNTAVGVNMVDVYQRSGRPHPKQPSFPYVPGSIHVGIVERCGEAVAGLAAGDRVVCMGSFGAYGERTVVDAARAVRVPADLQDQEVAAIFVRGLTAHYLTHLHHRVQPGESCLVHAAAGGLGQLLCRWLRHLGAHVMGTVGTAEKVAIASAAGCAQVVVRDQEDVVGRCSSWTDGAGVSVVYDSVGRDTVRQSIACLGFGGHVIVCGAASGTVEDFSLEWLHARSGKISRPTVATYVRTREQLQASAGAVFDAMRAGILRLDAIQPYALRDAAQAHRALESRRAGGIPILVP